MLPQDGAILLSFLNMKLRDGYPSPEALCDDLGEDCGALLAKMDALGYVYDVRGNRFVPKG